MYIKDGIIMFYGHEAGIVLTIVDKKNGFDYTVKIAHLNSDFQCGESYHYLTNLGYKIVYTEQSVEDLKKLII